jgi:hypothetical protein
MQSVPEIEIVEYKGSKMCQRCVDQIKNRVPKKQN